MFYILVGFMVSALITQKNPIICWKNHYFVVWYKPVDMHVKQGVVLQFFLNYPTSWTTITKPTLLYFSSFKQRFKVWKHTLVNVYMYLIMVAWVSSVSTWKSWTGGPNQFIGSHLPKMLSSNKGLDCKQSSLSFKHAITTVHPLVIILQHEAAWNTT